MENDISEYKTDMHGGCGVKKERKKAGISGYISNIQGNFTLIDDVTTPIIYYDTEDWEGVSCAVRDMCKDIGIVSGRSVKITNNPAEATILVGTLGRSSAIQELVVEQKIDTGNICGKWESFQIQVIDSRLVIVGSDKRGTIFGIYDLCQKIGVSPWYWWADVVPGYAEALYVTLTEPYWEEEPAVRYRGIFINDEYAFDNWAIKRGDVSLTDTYMRIYELLLRLKANTLWPAMHKGSPAFHDDPQNAANAERLGIVIGTSHCEQMLCNNELEYLPFEKKWEQNHIDKPLYKKNLPDSPVPCAYVWTEINPDTGRRVYNKELLREYWTQSIEQFGRYESIFTVGMRGLHDAGWQPVLADTPEQKAEQMNDILTEQRRILMNVLQKPIEMIPQLMIPYKEIQDIYDAGMNVPEDIILMWSDDNFGYLRRTPTDMERERSGGIGVYYHVGYHGDPNSYIWLSNVPFALIREEMTKAYECGANKIWILNVGDLKPAENQIEYFLDLARSVETMKSIDLREYVMQKAFRDFSFSEKTAREYADIMIRFQRLGFVRKPEHFCADLFQCEAYGDEALQYTDEYQNLVQHAEKLNDAVHMNDQSAFFELLLYPLRVSANTALKYINADKSRLYDEQGRGACVNQYAAASMKAYCRIVEDTITYNTLQDGKWDMIMDPYQSSFRKRGAALSNLIPTGAVSNLGYADLAISAELPLYFSAYRKNRCFIDLYNTGSGYVEWEIIDIPPWMSANLKKGRTIMDTRIWVELDWGKVPKGRTKSVLVVQWKDSEKIEHCQSLATCVENYDRKLPIGTFVEENGIISINASNYSACGTGGLNCWKVEHDLGRCMDVIKVYPNLARSAKAPGASDSAWVSYSVWITSTGTFPLKVYRLPSLNERGQQRLAVSMDDNKTSIILSGNNAYGNDAWAGGVLANVEILETYITIAEPGLHTLKLFHIDPGVMIEKLVIDTGGVYASCFGPPENGRVVFTV